MSKLKQLAGETVIYGVSSVLGRVLNYFALVPFFTRIFEPAEYGIVSVLYAYAGFLMIMYTCRMETAFFRFGNKEEEREAAFSTTALTVFAFTGLFWAIFFGFSGSIASWLGYAGHGDYVIWFALIVGFDALSAIPFARLRLEGKAIRFAGLKLLNILVNIIVVFFFLSLCPYLESVGIIEQGWLREDRISYVFIGNLTASTITMLFLLGSYGKLKLRFNKSQWKSIMVYALPLVVTGLAGIVNEVLDRVLLERYLPGTSEERLAQIGIYSACYKLAILMNLFTQAFNYAAEPFFFRNMDKEGSRELYARTAQLFTIAGCLAFLGICLYMDIAMLLIGAKFRSGLYVVPYLLLAGMFLGLYYNFAVWYKLSDKTVIGAWIGAGGAFITFLLNYLLIPKIGILGSAITTLVCYVSMAAAAYLTGRHYYPVPYPIRRMLFYISSVLVIYFAAIYIKPLFGDAFLIQFALSTFFISIFCLSLYLKEKELLLSLIKTGNAPPL